MKVEVCVSVSERPLKRQQSPAVRRQEPPGQRPPGAAVRHPSAPRRPQTSPEGETFQRNTLEHTTTRVHTTHGHIPQQKHDGKGPFHFPTFFLGLGAETGGLKVMSFML